MKKSINKIFKENMESFLQLCGYKTAAMSPGEMKSLICSTNREMKFAWYCTVSDYSESKAQDSRPKNFKDIEAKKRRI